MGSCAFFSFLTFQLRFRLKFSGGWGRSYALVFEGI